MLSSGMLLVATWIIVVPIVVVVIAGLIVLYVVWGKGKRLENQILEAENHIGQIKSNNIKEKLAKLEVIGKNNVVFNSVFEEHQGLLNESENYYNLEIVPDIDKAKAELKAKKYDNTIVALRGLNEKISVYEDKVQKINTRLDEVLKDDNETRSYEATVKAKFKEYKDLYHSMEDDVIVYKTELERREIEISEMFAGYEDNLHRGNFTDAQDELHAIEKKTLDAMAYLNDNHQSIVMVTKELPQRLNEVITMYNEMKDQYPLYHIAVSTNVNEIKNDITGLGDKLRVFDTANLSTDIQSTVEKIDSLRAKLENERNSRIEYEEKHDDCCNKESEIEKSHTKYMREVSQLGTVYHVDDSLKAKSAMVRNEVNKLSIIRKGLDSLECANQPYSLRITKIREMAVQIDAVEKAVQDYKSIIEHMKDDAEYAYKLIYDASYQVKNAELDLRNARHDVLTARYVNQFNKVYELIEKLNELTSHTPIDTAEVKKNTSELNMSSEKLLHDVSEDLLNKEFAEKLILFANIYRGSFSDVARSVNKAEELYFAGRFKEAVDIVLTATSRFETPEPLKKYKQGQ